MKAAKLPAPALAQVRRLLMEGPPSVLSLLGGLIPGPSTRKTGGKPSVVSVVLSILDITRLANRVRIVFPEVKGSDFAINLADLSEENLKMLDWAAAEQLLRDNRAVPPRGNIGVRTTKVEIEKEGDWQRDAGLICDSKKVILRIEAFDIGMGEVAFTEPVRPEVTLRRN